MEIYWPGTKIVKSQDNAFTAWKKPKESVMANDDSHRKSRSATKSRSSTGEVPSYLRIYKEKK